MVDRKELNMKIEELAASLRSGAFADRPTLKEAFDYVADVARASDNGMAVWTAVMVVCNTISNEMIKAEVK